MTRVKICGLTTLEDAQQAVELGAWALGMIFWPKSPRACPIEQAEAIGAQLHRRVELTGVFVNAPLDEVAVTADVCRFSLLQLHGDEGPAYCGEVARRTGAKVMKAVRVRDAAQLTYLQRFHTDFHLLDAYSPRTSRATASRSRTTAGTTGRPRRSRSTSGRRTPTRPGPARAAVAAAAGSSPKGPLRP